MQITENHVVGELVAQEYRTAAVFKAFKIDFCCKGNRTIAEVCNKTGIDAPHLIKELTNVLQTSAANVDNANFNSWPPDLLIDYIEKKHHRYVRAKIQEIIPYLTKVASVHGETHPNLPIIRELFLQTAHNLTEHMMKEENVLFPYIRTMTNAIETGSDFAEPFFGSVQNPIAMMHHEHNDEGERFRQISQLTNDYNPPQYACNTFRVTFALLKEFEEDLHQHIHLENNVLFPKAIELENHLCHA